MIEFLSQPWPWYVAGPLIGLLIPLLLITGNKPFGVSSTLRDICAATLPKVSDYFKYNWKEKTWNLLFVTGIALGAALGSTVFADDNPIDISENTKADLEEIGIHNYEGYVPAEIFSWENIDVSSLILLIGGGLLIGFGTRYADGCTSGHSIFGLSILSWVSLVATIGFFIGGLLASWILLPLILG
ncbi:MAG: YeeE/YedE family protein [Flavobacteriales bacterium]